MDKKKKKLTVSTENIENKISKTKTSKTKTSKSKKMKELNNNSSSNSTKSNSKLKQNLKMNKYIKEIKKTSYKSVSMKLHSQLKKKDLPNSQKKEIEKDIEMLKKWRENNPNNNNKSNIPTNKKLLNKQVINHNINKKTNKLLESSIKEFKHNLNNDFLGKNKNHNKIKQLTTKEILNLIKDE
jgi:truncated hemoglobin YjbI